MEEKKTVKISLGTTICIFIILILIIALCVTYYLGFIKNNQNDVTSNQLYSEKSDIATTNTEKQNTIKDNSDKEQKIEEQLNQKKYIIYMIQPNRELLEKEYFEYATYGDEQIVFYENGTFSAYLGWGMNISGTYNKENNNIYCDANKFFADNMPDQTITASIYFKIIDESTIEIINTSKEFIIRPGDLINNTLTNEEKEMSLHPFVKGIKFLKQNSNNTNISTTNSEFLSSSEIEKILGPDDAFFCIENIEKSGEEYVITAYMLEDERKITKEEYNKVLNGGEIEFRNLKWKKDNNTQIQIEDGMVIKSGEKQLAIIKEEGIYVFENIAGAKAGGLRDYSGNSIKFKVAKDILISGMLFTELKYDNNGKIKAYNASGEEIKNYKGITFDELLNKSKTRTGTYEECKAMVRNGKVDAIRFLED